MVFLVCVGCGCAHHYSCFPGHPSPNWIFNGDVNLPSFTPSLLIFTRETVDQPRQTVCHLFVTDGKLSYCGDCPHKFSGKVMDMVDIPSDYGFGE